jgi:hypothetical protein
MPALRKSIDGPLVVFRAWTKRIIARRATLELRALRRRVEAARLV